jgi:hypothetical protein
MPGDANLQAHALHASEGGKGVTAMKRLQGIGVNVSVTFEHVGMNM